MGSRCLRISRLLVSLFLFLFFFYHRNIVLAKLILKPSDTESLVGALAFFNCSTDNVAEEIFWFHYAVGSTDRKIIYGYKKLYEARFQLEKTEAAAGAGTVAFNLVIPVVTDKDAGAFECQDGAGQGERSPQVQMVVLVGPAVCETDIRRPEGVIGPNSCGLTPEDIQLTCKVKFLGNEPPIVAWFREDSNQPITNGVSHSHSNDYVIHNVTIAADSSIDGRSFECRPTRSPPPPAAQQHLCATETVTVVGNNAVSNSTLFVVIIICLAIALPVAFIMGCVVDRRLVINRRKRKKLNAKAEDDIPLIESATGDTAKREEEGKRIKDELDRYENMIYRKVEVKYKEKPTFAHEIKTKQRSSLISGVTLWRNRLYIVHENCSSIEVYDSKTFTLENSLPVKNLANPLDIASSESSECLYVADKPGIQLETSQPVKENTQTPIHQSKVNEKDAVEIKSNEESLPHDDKGDKSKKNVQKNKEDEFKRKENSPKILEKDPTKNNKDQSSDRSTTDEAPIDTTDHLPGEHQTGEQLTGSNKDNETPGGQQQQSTDDEKKKLPETTQSKDDRNEGELKEEDKKHSQKNDKKDPSSMGDENNHGKDQVTAEVQKDQTVDGRTEEPQTDANINPLKACKAECRILALSAREVSLVQNNSPWSVDDVECRLSVAYSSSNVIVCLQNKRQIIEFSSSGKELRRIRLSPGDGFHQLFHAIRVSHSYFAVSHCKAPPRSDDHRLSIIDEKGKIRFTSNDLNSFKLVSKNERMNMASYLIVDCNKSILMSDAINCRVLLFNATLKTRKELIPADGVLTLGLKNQPTRITLDEENGRLFIALKQKDEKMSQNEGVSVFQVA